VFFFFNSVCSSCVPFHIKKKSFNFYKMDNLSQQAEEMEVLTSIFEDQWKYNKVTNSYSIQLAKDIELWITLNPKYPSDRPPKYELWAPNFSKAQKDLVDNRFTQIYETNQGCPVIYQWIDKLKEIAFTTAKGKKGLKDFNDNLINQIKGPKNKQKKGTALEIFHGPTISDRRSTFQGHACRVTESKQVKEFLENLYQNKKISQAKHNILAYRIVTGKNEMLEDFDNDGEDHAGGRLLHLLEVLDLQNVAVVVTRWYGGIHLGPDRFKHINNAARQVVSDAGFLR